MLSLQNTNMSVIPRGSVSLPTKGPAHETNEASGSKAVIWLICSIYNTVHLWEISHIFSISLHQYSYK